MIVKELIEKLQEYDPELKVVDYHDEQFIALEYDILQDVLRIITYLPETK